jgi:uncharacterized membrane protein YfcA
VISGILGMGGGILLLAVLFCFLPYSVAIPAHAAVQLASNTTRVAGFIRHVDWRAFGRFCVGALPGAAVGVLLLWTLGKPERSEPYLKIVVGLYVLIVPLLPKPAREVHRSRWWDFPLLGLAAGAAALTVGAVGPLIAPLFLRRDFVKERLVATKAMCQMILHATKIPAFIWLWSLELRSLGIIVVLMCVAVIPGTLVGKYLHRYVTEQQFVVAYRIALIVTGLKVLYYDGIRLL